MDTDLDDTHLCIKCNCTIVGLDNYIQHRKRNCSASATSTATATTKVTTSTSSSTSQTNTEVTSTINYEPFSFHNPEPPNTAIQSGKTSKAALGDSYELPYELEADVFFSSLQLQSVQSTVGHHVPSLSGGKTTSLHHTGPLTRQKSMQQEAAVNWMGTPQQTSGENFLKEGIFKNMNYGHESPEVTEEEEEEDEEDNDMDDNDDDEDYDPIADTHGSGGKWKSTLMRQSPPVVPISHTGGKWRPENRPSLRVAHSQLSRASPTWDDNLDEPDTPDQEQNPPAEHTKGKWVPGTKLQRLEYKQVVELAKCSQKNQDYWCNICCRKLKSKLIYENHLKSSYHLKRAEPELQLEKAVIKGLHKDDITKNLALAEFKPLSITVATSSKKRKRRCTYLKCSLCKHVMSRHLIGKHLISHYHYRRMQLQPGVSLSLILEHIHAIVLQSPFQCRPCRFYANTEDMFLLHWNSAAHLDASEGPGQFWCSYCQFECEDNNQMRRHLLAVEHKEVLLAINRSVPICISKKLSLACGKCGQVFRYNFELRQHFVNLHAGVELMGTASDDYQSKFRCLSCSDVLSSKIALQRHEKFKHFINKYFCSICNLEFFSPCQARRHRKTLEHKQKALSGNQKTIGKDERKDVLKLKEKSKEKCGKICFSNNPSQKEETKPVENTETSKPIEQELVQNKSTPVFLTYKCKDCPFTGSIQEELSLHNQNSHLKNTHSCILCSEKFATAQELGRHTRLCKPTTMLKPEEIKMPTQLQEITSEKGEKIWLCDLCDFKAPFRSELLYHRVFHSFISAGKNQLLPCPLCDKSFRKQSLRFHLHNHTKENLFKCDICSSSFSRPNNLKDHIKNKHGDGSKNVVENQRAGEEQKLVIKDEKMFPCASCDKIFKNKHSMKMHHLTHHVTDSMPAADRHLFKCTHENCNYSSVSKSLLNIHSNSHSMESFQCTEKDCNYVGKSKLHLKRHLQSHLPANEIKHFSCKQCHFKTKIKGHLKRHMRQHTGEKPYSCPHCNFRSTTWENLRKHILKTDKHAGKFVFECQKCKEEKSFIDKEKPENSSKKIFKTNSHQEYQQHLKNVHKAEK